MALFNATQSRISNALAAILGYQACGNQFRHDLLEMQIATGCDKLLRRVPLIGVSSFEAVCVGRGAIASRHIPLGVSHAV
jgi:hypothetical protein